MQYNLQEREIKRLKSLCYFYMILALIFLITTIIFLLGWLDLQSIIIKGL